MKVNTKQKYFHTGLVLAIFLLLWNPLPASSFSEKGGSTNTAGGDKAGVTMQTVSGQVVETIDSGGYTYARVSKDGSMSWVALPKSKIKVGNEITCQPGMVMNNFSSASLRRSFKQIVFSSGLASISAGTAPLEETSTPDETSDVPKPKSKLKENEEWGDFFGK